MEQIKILSIKRGEGYFEVSSQIRVPIPAILNALPNKVEIADSYKTEYGIDKVDGDDIIFLKTRSFTDDKTMAEVIGAFQFIRNEFITGFETFTPKPEDYYIGKAFDGTDWTYTPPPITPTP